MKKLTNLIGLVCVLGVVWILASCSRLPMPTPIQTAAPTGEPVVTRTPAASPTTTPAVPKGTISIWHSWDEKQRPALLRRIAAFQEQYPDVQFDVLYVPLIDLRSAFEDAAAEGAGPSILIGPAEWGPSLYGVGSIASLDELATAELLNTLNPAAVEAGTYEQQLIGLPLHLEGVVMYRNQAIIPAPPATFDELVTLAERATQGEIVGAVLERSFFFSAGHLYGLGGQLLEHPGGEPAFYNPIGVAWVNLLQSFEQAGPTEYFTDADLDLFKEGQVGMIIDSTNNRSSLVESLGRDNLHIDPWPIHGDGALSGFILAENIYLSSPQTNPRIMENDQGVAWQFIEFFMTPESQSALASVGLIPALNGSPALEYADLVSPDDPLIREAMVAFTGAASYPTIPEINVYPGPIDLALRSVFFQESQPEAALQNAYEMILQELEEMRSMENQSP